MPSPNDDRIEELLAEYRDAREQAVETRRRINEVQATATAPRQVVKVTVGAQGQLAALEFPTAAYRNLPPKELSKVITATFERARTQALSKASEVTLGRLLGGVSTADLLQGRVDPSSLLPEELELPDAVRAYVEHELGGTKEGADHE
ncbi:YbaB/EbfC family nucleoid-associated protein [Streptomyces sp. NPDC048278]|uniref:YbaB/EbfC family nucleoid-associated protein n=1 Tax=Streptomyces sp. NPDC048278 TaxID=3155809 RepID=UPI003417A39A